ncbi:unnamed protein product [Acanthoscelides obtectus]|nr:unnamed protein product [Acanthoscelides obtectus]CAK1628314.1 hypothetical protein AOBTE_LOCUS5130 [Acanthoscelides obtectus]
MVSAQHANSFIIEETCSETTVENFIPHPTVGFGAGQVFLPTDPKVSNNVIQSTIPSSSEELTADLLGNEAHSSVKILFKTSDGSFVTVSDEVLQNLQKDDMQYQVIDEVEKLGDVQDLQLTKDMTNAAAGDIPLFPETFDLFGNAQTDSANITNEPREVVDNAGALIDPENVGIPSLDTEGLNESYPVEKHKRSMPSLDFSPDMFFAD